MSCIKGCDRNVSAVYNAEILFKWIHAPDCVVAASLFLARGASSDASGAETGARPIGCAGVVWEAEDGDVERL
jgi:hypothetical protein